MTNTQIDADTFIQAALDLGSSLGLDALDSLQRRVFLIFEAEVLCDMEGIESFLDRYGDKWLDETVMQH